VLAVVVEATADQHRVAVACLLTTASPAPADSPVMNSLQTSAASNVSPKHHYYYKIHDRKYYFQPSTFTITHLIMVFGTKHASTGKGKGKGW